MLAQRLRRWANIELTFRQGTIWASMTLTCGKMAFATDTDITVAKCWLQATKDWAAKHFRRGDRH